MKTSFDTFAEAYAAGYTSRGRGVLASHTFPGYGRIELRVSDTSGGNSFGYSFGCFARGVAAAGGGWDEERILDEAAKTLCVHCGTKNVYLASEKARMGAGCVASMFVEADLTATVEKFKATVAGVDLDAARARVEREIAAEAARYAEYESRIGQ